jgi:hypothetical protein
MFAMFPKVALILTLVLFVLGIVFGWLTDLIIQKLGIGTCEECKLQVVHARFLPEKPLSLKHAREFFGLKWLLTGIALFFIFLNLSGLFGPKKWNTERIGFVVLMALSMVFFLISSSHYLKTHVWQHIIKKHIWRVFLWTAGTLLLVDIGLHYWDLQNFLKTHN